MKKYSKFAIALIFVGFFTQTPYVSAEETGITAFFQDRMTERREIIRERLGAATQTPLSPEALLVVDQIIQKFTYASDYMHDMGIYLSALNATYTPDARIAEQIEYLAAEESLRAVIADMNNFRTRATKETVDTLSALAVEAKTHIEKLSTLQLSSIESLRKAKVPAYLLTFDTCGFGPSKATFFVPVEQMSGMTTLSFNTKKAITPCTQWNTTDTHVGIIRIEDTKGSVATENIFPITTQSNGTLESTITIPKELMATPILVAVITDALKTSENTFVVPLTPTATIVQ